jgi:hypothetical protein
MSESNNAKLWKKGESPERGRRLSRGACRLVQYYREVSAKYPILGGT